jgi:hypothetical protein
MNEENTEPQAQKPQNEKLLRLMRLMTGYGKHTSRFCLHKSLFSKAL